MNDTLPSLRGSCKIWSGEKIPIFNIFDTELLYPETVLVCEKIPAKFSNKCLVQDFHPSKTQSTIGPWETNGGPEI